MILLYCQAVGVASFGSPSLRYNYGQTRGKTPIATTTPTAQRHSLSPLREADAGSRVCFRRGVLSARTTRADASRNPYSSLKQRNNVQTVSVFVRRKSTIKKQHNFLPERQAPVLFRFPPSKTTRPFLRRTTLWYFHWCRRRLP